MGSGRKTTQKRHHRPSNAKRIIGGQNHHRGEISRCQRTSNPVAAIAKIANDVAKTKRLCDIMFNPGRRRTQTKPGKL